MYIHDLLREIGITAELVFITKDTEYAISVQLYARMIGWGL